MSEALKAAQAEMLVRAREVLQRLHERDKARGWTPTPMRWPGRSSPMEAVDYWNEGATNHAQDADRDH